MAGEFFVIEEVQKTISVKNDVEEILKGGESNHKKICKWRIWKCKRLNRREVIENV